MQELVDKKKHVNLTYFAMVVLCYGLVLLQAHRFLSLIGTGQSEGQLPAHQAFRVVLRPWPGTDCAANPRCRLDRVMLGHANMCRYYQAHHVAVWLKIPTVYQL